MIRLLPLDEPELAELVRDPGGGVLALVSNSAEVLDFLQPVLVQSLEWHRRTISRPPWHSYLALDPLENRAVGVCAFKGSPNEAGVVEISYGTVPKYEGHGHATAMARALIEIAFRSPAVRRVVAHTLPEPNASTRVLHKAGLTKTGEVMDPDDGKVWRWEIARPA